MPVRLDTVGLVVRDMAASLAFFRLLGLDAPAEHDGDHVELAVPGGPTLGLDTEVSVRELDPQWTPPPPAAGGRLGLQFRYDAPADVDRAYAAALSAGHESYVAPWDAFWGQRFARLRDPDGNVTSLFAPLPAASEAA